MTTETTREMPVKKFYMRFLTMAAYDLVVVYAFTFVVFGLTIVWDSWTNGPILRGGLSLRLHIQTFVTLGFIASPVVLILVAVLRRYFPFRVTVDGLHTFSIAGKPLFLPWSKPILSIRTRWLIGITTLEIQTDDKTRYVVSDRAWMTDSQGFVQAVQEAAGPDHPLAQWLREHWVYEEE
ncbi:MAG: hypothetical protein ACRC8S_17520 [Fimbriiglobus sp.]